MTLLNGGVATIQVDFAEVCPFFQLHKRGLDANYGPCSVLFRNNMVSYAYAKGCVRCTYCSDAGVAPWNKDNMCPGSVVTPYVTINFNNMENMTADLWRYEWFMDNFLILCELPECTTVAGVNLRKASTKNPMQEIKRHRNLDLAFVKECVRSRSNSTFRTCCCKQQHEQ